MESSDDTELSERKSLPSSSVTRTSISLSTFRKLPIEIQLDYAQSNGLQDTHGLTTDDICSALFKETESIPVQNIEGHVRIITSEGVVVAREVMDLVDWLVEHHIDVGSSNTHLHSPQETSSIPMRDGDSHQRTSLSKPCISLNNNTFHPSGNLQQMAMELQRANTRFKVAVEESRKAVREVCADLLVFQNGLDTENVHLSTLANIITETVGLDVMYGIQQHVDLVGKKGPHLGSSACTSVAQVGRKRSRPASTTYHIVDTAYGNKRRRLNEDASSPAPQHALPQTILNYPNGNDDSDDTYTDSNGTERDFVDDPYSFHDSRGRSAYTALDAWNWKRESLDEESSSHSSQSGTPWRNIADLDEDCSDLDYEPPDWDLEDIWELDYAPRSYADSTHPLFQLNFADELDDCGGVLSDCGISTDDPDEGYRELGVLQRPSRDTVLIGRRGLFPASLGRHLKALDYDSHPTVWPADMTREEAVETIKQNAIIRDRRAASNLAKVRVERKMFPPLDLEKRLADVLGSDHTLFYFDNEEWMRFEDNLLSPSRRYVVP